MKSELTLTELAQTIETNEKAKRDFVAPSEKLWMTSPLDHKPVIELDSSGEIERFDINDVAHEQIAGKLGIPKKYYDRMVEEQPELLATNVNCWLRNSPEKRLVRTLDGTMRAFLSDRYRPLDNFLVAQAALPVLLEKDIEIKSCALTERRLYIQAVTPKIQGEVKEGDVIQAGIVLSNSEVGCGSVRIEPLLYRLACLNGMIRNVSLKRHHIGRRVDVDDVTELEFYRTETIEADNHAFLLKIEDTVRHAFDQIAFDSELDLLRAAEGRKIEAGKIENCIKEVTNRFNFGKEESDGVLSRLIEGADLSQYGLANAVTSLANDVKSYDRVVELERAGGQIIDLNPSEWHTMAAA